MFEAAAQKPLKLEGIWETLCHGPSQEQQCLKYTQVKPNQYSGLLEIEVSPQLHHSTAVKYLRATRMAKFSKQHTRLCLVDSIPRRISLALAPALSFSHWVSNRQPTLSCPKPPSGGPGSPAPHLSGSNVEAHLAALAGEEPVVVPGHSVPTHGAKLLQVFIVGVVHHFKLRH